jgi:hypothetical protein
VKIIIRTLIILAAALVVVGATMTYASSGTASGPGRDSFEGRPPSGFAEGTRPSGFPPGGGGGPREGHGDHEGGRGGFAAGELLKNLAIIAVIIAVVSLLNRIIGTRRPQRRSNVQID